MSRLRLAIAKMLARRLIAAAAARDPDFVIGGHDDPYLRRWWLIPRNRLFNIYLHQFLRSDDDRALHDHPWFNASFLLQGVYYEHGIRAGGVHTRRLMIQGDVRLRSPWAAHRIEIVPGPPSGAAARPEAKLGDAPSASPGCWSLFVTGPTLRSWGFHCPQGWRPWQEFTDARDKGAVGKGCA